MQFGGLATILWWCFIVINTWLMIAFYMRRTTFPHLEKYYLMVGYGLPTLSVIIALSTNQIGATISTTGGCWLLTTNDSAYQYALLYGPLGVALVIGGKVQTFTELKGVPMVLHSLYIIFKSTRAGDKSQVSMQVGKQSSLI